MTQMETRSYTLRFLTPAFLGDAEQNGAWRTPPFKALLRQWWRVAVAKDFDYDHARIREIEGRLFGNAWLDADANDRAANRKSGHCQSQVRMRISDWQPGKLTTEQLGRIRIPSIQSGKIRTDPLVYLGYGPVLNGPRLKANAAIQADESVTFSLAYPAEFDTSIQQALALIHAYGTAGGRSRNGWGSVSLIPNVDPLPKPLSIFLPLGSGLAKDWPLSIATCEDGRPAEWILGIRQQWPDAMRDLTELRLAARDAARNVVGGSVQARHILSFPTKAREPQFKSDARLPNALRFKVRMAAGGVQAVAFHMPHRLPDELFSRPGNVGTQQFEVWNAVHRALNNRPTHSR